MKKSLLIVVAFVLLGGALFIGTFDASAYQGDPKVQGPNFSSERHEAMTQAFAENDYNTWKSLMSGKGRVIQVINEDNFARFAEMHQLMVEGKTDEADMIRNELGLGLKNGANFKQGQGHGRNAQ